MKLELADGIVAYRRDCMSLLRSLPPASVDLIITDPAYESINKHRYGTNPRLVVWFPTISNGTFEELYEELYRVLKPNRHCYVMLDHETALKTWHYAVEAGFELMRPLIYDKVLTGMGYNYRASYEMVLFMRKGKKRRLKDLSVRDVISIKRPTSRKLYPTTKPDGLVDLFITQSSAYGELVLDPFLGSGSTAWSAHRLGRDFVGCDVQHLALAYAAQRFGLDYLDVLAESS